MSYCLSFSEEFFSGSDYLEDIESSDAPTNCLQAIISLDKAVQYHIAKEVLHLEHPVLAVMSESFPYLVLDKIRETNACADLSAPIEVYIDAEGWYSVEVYDDAR